MSTLTMADTDAAPYVGPQAFKQTDADKFFGREREAADLGDILIASRIVMLYSPSGAGKTSLLNAALIPQVGRGKRAFKVLPVIRVNHEPDPSATGAGANRFVTSALLSLEEALPEGERTPPEQLATMDFGTYLDRRRARAGNNQPELLVFDQFEEILTYSPSDLKAKAEFFDQVGAALYDRQRWAVFSLREDFVGSLDPYRHFIPTRLETTFRLDLLGAEAAIEAIQKPAWQQHVRFADAAAHKLVDDLSQVRIEQNGHVATARGPYVEPVQLQVICLRVWDQRARDAAEITERDVAAVGNVDDALGSYYDDRVAAVSAATNVSERAIRDWVDDQLITRQGIRGQVLLEAGQSQGLDNRAIHGLEDAHLVRAERRRGATWIELAHDRLIDPVRQRNREWFRANLTVLQREADAWDTHGRSSDLLLRGQLLRDAGQWAKHNRRQVTPIEWQFLSASRTRQQLRFTAIGTTLLVSLMLVALSGWAWTERGRAADQRDLAEQGEAQAKAARGTAEAEQQRAENEEAAAEAARITAEAEQQRAAAAAGTAAAARSTAEAERGRAANAAGTAEAQRNVADDQRLTAEAASTQAVLAQATAEVALEEARSGKLAFQAMNRSDAKVDLALLLGLEAVNSADTEVARGSLMGSIAAADDVAAFLRGHETWVRTVEFNSDGTILASADSDGVVMLWAANTGMELGPALVGPQAEVRDLSFSADGQILAASSLDGKIYLWDVTTGEPWSEPLVPEDGGSAAHTVAFDPINDDRLAAGYQDGSILLWDVKRRSVQVTLQRPVGQTEDQIQGGIIKLEFTPNGELLVSAGLDGRVIRWDPEEGRQRGEPLPVPSGIEFYSLAIDPTGEMASAGASNGTILWWSLSTGEELGRIQGQNTGVSALAFSHQDRQGGQLLVSGGTTQGTILWDLATGKPHDAQLSGYSGQTYSLDFSPWGWPMASGLGDGTIVLWTTTPMTRFTWPLATKDQVASVAFTADSTKLVSASFEGQADLWDVNPQGPMVGERTGSILFKGFDHNLVATMAVSHDGSTFAASGCSTLEDDGQCSRGGIWLWDVETGEPIVDSIAAHADWVTKLSFGRDGDGTSLASGSIDGEVNLWNVATGDRIHGPLEVPSAMTSLVLGPGDAIVASGHADGSIVLSTPATGDKARVLAGHESNVRALAFNQDGSLLASGGDYGEVMLWDTESGTRVREPMDSHSGRVDALAFHPNDSTLASAGSDRALVLWDIETLLPIGSPMSWSTKWSTGADNLESATAIAFSPDGQRLVLGGKPAGMELESSSLLLLNIELDFMQSVACQLAGRNLSQTEAAAYLDTDQVTTICPNALLHSANGLMRRGDQAAANKAVAEAVRLAEQIEDDTINSIICWQGSLNGFARIVLPTCERALALLPEDGNSYYNRGLARALVGDHQGAALDFRRSIPLMQQNGVYLSSADEREEWITALEAGENPFDSATLRLLRFEYLLSVYLVPGSYTSPAFGFSLEWDDDVWTQTAFWQGDSGYVALATADTWFSIEGITVTKDLPKSCVANKAATYTETGAEPVPQEWRLKSPGASTGANRIFMHSVEANDGTRDDLVVYIECRPLGDGDGMVVITAEVSADAYEEVRPLLEELLAGITVGGVAETGQETRAVAGAPHVWRPE